METVVRLSSKNQIVIPKEVRQRLHIGAGDQLFVQIADGTVVMIPRPKSYARHTLGVGKKVWKGEAAETVRKERAAWDKKRAK